MNPQWLTRLSNQKKPQPNSPDRFSLRTIAAKLGVNRVTMVPMLIAIGFMTIVAVIICCMVSAKSNAAQEQVKKDAISKSETAKSPDFLEKHPQDGVITPSTTELIPALKPDEAISPANGAFGSAPTGANGQPMNPYQEYRYQQWQQREQERQNWEANRRDTLHQALNADTTVFSGNQTRPGQNPLTTLYGNVKQQTPGSGTSDGQLNYAQAQPGAVNIPTEPPDTANYLMHTRVQPVSPFEVKAGTVIPSVMLGGINSDLPGQIIAQVSQNVYDTATGQYLLIPQGTRLVGNYDHQVVSGQKRVLVLWSRLIYPDASSVNLAGMSGADQGGYTGFTDKTNTHFWPTFRNALMLSAITAGVQLSQPRAQKGDYSYSSQQMGAGSLGMQMNQLGAATISRNLSQAPTLTIRPGYVFNVMVNKDVILPPWQKAMASSGGEN